MAGQFFFSISRLAICAVAVLAILAPGAGLVAAVLPSGGGR